MSTTRDYWTTLRVVRDAIAAEMGVDARYTAVEGRALAGSGLAVSAALAKLLVDKGVVTDGELQAAITAATGSDGSVWDVEPIDPTRPPDPTGTFDAFPGEDFEAGANGDDVTPDNTNFTAGQVGDSLLPGTGYVRFDTSVHNGGDNSAKVHTSGGWSRALRSGSYASTNEVYARFYFRAAAGPAMAGCRIFAFQLNPATGSSNGADAWSLELAVDTAGKPTMVDNGTNRPPTSPPTICTNDWCRIEIAMYGTTCETRLYIDGNSQGTSPDFSWTAAYSAGLADSFVVGQPRSHLTSAQSWDCWVDDVDVSTTGWVGI